VLPSTLTIRGVLRGTFNSIFMYGVSVSTSPLIYHMQSSVSKPLRCWNHGKQRLARGTHGIREGQSSVHNSRNHRRTAPYSFLQVIQPLYKRCTTSETTAPPISSQSYLCCTRALQRIANPWVGFLRFLPAECLNPTTIYIAICVLNDGYRGWAVLHKGMELLYDGIRDRYSC
jgi:hypothetical protein